MDNKQLINRLNRIGGQIEALKRDLETGKEKDCLQTIHQVKAIDRAIKKFAESYTAAHLEACLARGVSKKDMQSQLQEVLHSAFTI